MLVHAPNLSYVVLTAREVHRLAVQSIADIDNARRQRVNEALKEVENETCSHFFGLYRHKCYPTRDIALKHAPEVQAAKRYANGDRLTCELLQKAAQHLLDNDNLPEEQKVLHISLFDFRALGH
jgi:hypothetical protein